MFTIDDLDPEKDHEYIPMGASIVGRRFDDVELSLREIQKIQQQKGDLFLLKYLHHLCGTLR